ncbi:hypothetical protein LCGC14_0456630 [marine sediment metagenome]|uniref:Uncharacterized protein n=1 Tax=marine sediment metagenome TaxID=412755 RepID=A0A0F9V303_9ZZZZ
MSEEQQPDVITDEVVAHQEETDTPQESQAAEPAAPEPTQKEKDQEYNWRRMRETMEELQHRNRALEDRLDERSKPVKAEEDDTDEIERLPDDELLTKAQTKRLMAKAAKQAAEEAASQIVKKRDLETLDDRVRMRYQDYNSIVTPDSLEELKSDPLFVKTLRGLADPFDQACFVYEQLKLRGRSGYEGVEKKQLAENSAKPRSQQALGGPSPLHSANQYAAWPDPALKKQLFQEMQEAAKGA